MKKVKIKNTSTPIQLNIILTKELHDFLDGKVTNSHVKTVYNTSNAIMRTMCV